MDEAATHRIETQALIAGAWARGLADAFSLLGLPAIFLDAEGSVLHAGRETLAHFGPTLAIDRRRLVVADPAGREQLAAALARAEGRQAQRARLADSGLVAHVLAIPQGPGQIVAHVVLLLDAADTAAEGLATAILARSAAPTTLAH